MSVARIKKNKSVRMQVGPGAWAKRADLATWAWVAIEGDKPCR